MQRKSATIAALMDKLVPLAPGPQKKTSSYSSATDASVVSRLAGEYLSVADLKTCQEATLDSEGNATGSGGCNPCPHRKICYNCGTHPLIWYDPRKYNGIDEDDSDMEANFDDILKEERRSARIAHEEDERERLLIEEEEKRERLRKEAKRHKLTQR